MNGACIECHPDDDGYCAKCRPDEDTPELTDEQLAEAKRNPGLGWKLSQETIDLLAEIDKSIIRWPR